MTADEMADPVPGSGLPGERVADVLSEEGVLPYMARISEYVSEDSTGEQRAREMAEFDKANVEAERKNDEFVDRIVAAVDASPSGGEGLAERQQEGRESIEKLKGHTAKVKALNEKIHGDGQ